MVSDRRTTRGLALTLAGLLTLVAAVSLGTEPADRASAQATPVINAADFPSIQAALDSLASSGGAVYIPAGTHSLPAKIRVFSNVTVFGAGMDQTVLQFAPGVVDHLMSNSSLTAGNTNLVVRDLTLAGRNDVANGCCFGLRLVNVRSSFVISVASDGHSLDGIYLGYNQQNGAVNNRVSGCRTRNNGRNGIAITHGSGNVIDTCVVDANNRREQVAGIDLEPDDGLNVSDNKIVSNQTTSQNVGIQLFAFDRARVTVSNNAVCTNTASGNVNAGIFDFNGSANIYVNNSTSGNGNNFLVDPSALVGPQYAGACQLGSLPARPPLPPSAVTPTPTVPPSIGTPTPQSPCAPQRPQVRVTATPSGPGQLSVGVTVDRPSNAPNNTLRSLRFGAATNGLIDIGATVGSTGGITVSFPAGTRETSFVVRRAAAGQPMTVPFIVVDDCGDWPTFVGGGPAAF